MVREGSIRSRKRLYHHLYQSCTKPSSGLSDKCPLCLWEDKDGRIWIGTDGGGINCFDRKRNILPTIRKHWEKR
ncbi:two-component regulator propeller domain-containing protein [Phocaeicola dorei]|uniref:two-component regulator propeller domain-containing protein n=1 Tax=Phocaeicola dorei TaxID=357276 RepID=UPI0032E3CF11